FVERPESSSFSTQSEPLMNDATHMTYSITVLTGNRWGADSEVDLFMTIYGDVKKSDLIVLEENEVYYCRLFQPHPAHHRHPHHTQPLHVHCAWLQARVPKFGQNQLDTFHTVQPHLGTLQKVVLGHDVKGYGAGIFIDHVLITENVVEGRQFVFYINKWFDSGQVDGKLVRTVPLSAFYYIGSIPSEATPTLGRWEFVLHSGLPTGEGGTTSNLRFIGFGSTGVSISVVDNDNSLQKVPSTSLIQIDFGTDIGELLKVRIEVDGVGAKPDYYIEYVEMRDLDTEERLAIRVSNWLDVTGTRTKKPQAFRELAAQLVGEYSDSGVFPLVSGKDEKKGDYSFKVECVHLGKIQYIKIYPDFTDLGRDIFDGLSLLQNIYDKRGVPSIGVAEGIIASSSWVRQSTHDPYRFTLTESHVQDWEDDEEDMKRNGTKERRQFKKMGYESNSLFSAIKPLFTRSKKKDEEAIESDDWLLSFTVDGSPTPPRVMLVVETDEFEMERVEPSEGDPATIMHYQLQRSPPVGRVDKLRIWSSPDLDPANLLHVHRMRLVNRANNEQIRYPAAESPFEPDSIVEFPAVYPDMAPRISIQYTVAMETLEMSDDAFVPYVQITGSDSNTGFRPLHGAQWEIGSRVQFVFEAIDIGTPTQVQLRLEPHDAPGPIRWSGNVMVAGAGSETHYTIDGAM
ncbi:hypothetical protein PFISCL1PPCAC_18466, partial [Pristionchus fissidentatus]